MFKTTNGIIIDENTLNRYEIENHCLSYRTAWDRLSGNSPLILCNNLPEIDPSIYDNVVVGDLYDEETDNYAEVFQYYLTDLTDWGIEYIKENSQSFTIAYSETLDLYVLMVTHYGTAWDYVLSDVEIV